MTTSSTRGVRLHYEERGTGEPLLILPGAGEAAVALVDSGLADLFARRYRVILMDVTGLGRSGRVTHMQPGQWAEDVISVLDAAGVEQVHLVGSSLGGRIAARVAAESPHRVRSLVVDMPITGLDDGQEAQIDAFFSAYRSNFLAAAAPRWHGDTWTEAMDFFVALRRTRMFREFYSPASFLASIVAPTLLCRGDAENPAHPLSQATDWHRAARRSRLWIEPGAEPALARACPDRFVGAVVDFTAAVAGDAVVLGGPRPEPAGRPR